MIAIDTNIWARFYCDDSEDGEASLRLVTTVVVGALVL